jgi:hypothetical protein
MGFIDRLRKAFSAGGPGAGRPANLNEYWVYAKCRRCGEPLKTRINLANDPSLADDGETFIVRKGLVGTGARRCFQTVEVTMQFSQDKRQVIDRQITGGEFLTLEEYEALASQPAQQEQEDA